MESRKTDGLLLVDKPSGMTSHDVVAVARRALGERRIGHGGTLDPFATGLLVLLSGHATRLMRYLDAEPKEYEATVRLGSATDTDDLTGTVVRTAPVPSRSEVNHAIERLTGKIQQLPPSYSAKQVAGVRAHAAARRGAPIELAPVAVTVHSWETLEMRSDEIDVRISCSGGTYIRALARDLGEIAGSAAHLVALRRTRSGAFAVGDAAPFESLASGEARLVPMLRAVGHLPRVDLQPADALRVAHGNDIPAEITAPLAALVADGELVAIAAGAGSRWQPRVVLDAGDRRAPA
jgi:tRNA pseudouridine55 synthase